MWLIVCTMFQYVFQWLKEKTYGIHFELIAFICKNVITLGDDATLLEAKDSSVLCSYNSSNRLLTSKSVHLNGAYVLHQ